MGCVITSGITIACADLKRVGGINKRFWLFNLDDLATPIAAAQTGYVTNIPLTTYRTLYKVEGAKFSHSFEINEQRTDSGNVQWEHKLIMKVFNSDPTEDATLEQFAVGEFGAIVQTNNLEFLILGAQNGMTSSEAKVQSGVKSGDDSTSMVTLLGNESTIYKRLLRTDFNTTLQMLNAMSV